MKRQRGLEGLESIDLSNCLMLLSCPQQTYKPQRKSFEPVEFECKTCNRKFSSFQALGGHRAGHKRSKLDGYHEDLKAHDISSSMGNKQPKMHECSICGLKFSLGQALGGHMRRHKAHVVINQEFSSIEKVDAKVPIVFNRSNGARVVCLDLNLTPLENDL